LHVENFLIQAANLNVSETEDLQWIFLVRTPENNAKVRK
jgi:hypothetical protein